MKTKLEILKITNPVFLFSDNAKTASEEYKSFAKYWHPDLNKDPDAHKVFVHIKLLYEQALEMFERNTWDVPGLLKIKDKNKTTYYKIKYHVTYKFELGDMYIGDGVILYLIDNKYSKYFLNMLSKINSIKYRDSALKTEFEKLMPVIHKTFETQDNRNGIIIRKTKDLLLLKDVLRYYDNKIEPRHVAWILNRLYNLVCFYVIISHFSHNNISLDTCFISPEHHSVSVLGGWFYTTYYNNNLIGVTKDIFNIIPPDIKAKKQASSVIDLESIKLLGRTLLGDASGMNLSKLHKNIDPLIMWLRVPSKRNPQQDYEIYNKVLLETFGPKKFVKLDLDVKKLYNL